MIDPRPRLDLEGSATLELGSRDDVHNHDDPYQGKDR